MIYESTLEAVYGLADKMGSRGLRVTPLSTTPVAQLVQAGHLPVPAKGVDELDPIEERIIKGSQLPDPSGACRHDVTIDEMSDVIAETVRNNLDLARNGINPIVKEVATDVEQYVNDAESINRTHVSVVPVNYADVWNSPVLSEMVSRYRETSIEEVRLSIGVPCEDTKESLVELAKTGASRFDQELEEWFESLSDALVVETFNGVFGENPASRARTLNDVIHSGDHLLRPELTTRALLTHLFARKLMQEIPEGVKSDLETYRLHMATVMSQSGRVINAIMERREANIQRRQLVAGWPQGREQLGKYPFQVYVNGDVYNRWLEEGGEPDAILGSFVTDQRRGYNELLEGTESYAKEWQRKARVMATTQRFNRFNHALEGMRLAVTRQINEFDEENLVVPREELHKRLSIELKSLKGNFHEHIYVCARMIVCNTMFPHTLGLEILTAIDSAANDNPEISIREAALLATIEIVSSWVAKLCKVEYLKVGSV